MPGVIMADSEHHGSLSNHDRQPELSGTDPVANANERIQEKRKGSYGHEPEISPEIKQPTMESLNIDRPAPEVQVSQDRPRDIPPEVEHISAGFVSFGSFITRLAQQTHHRLTNTISELAQMPAPSSMVNGNGLVSSVSEDTSPENVAKKVKLLQFAQTVHAEWVKALVLNNWSRKAGDVSKIIDLKNHLHSQETLYNEVIEGMSMVKLNLHHARMPNPDLKTALEVLTSGKASWMPDVWALLSFLMLS